MFPFSSDRGDRRKRNIFHGFLFLLGAHMNPAVTLAFAVVRRLPWFKVPVYCIAQLLGAFIASAVVYGIYYGRS